MPRRRKQTAPPPPPPRPWPAVLLGLLGFLLVVAELDATGAYWWLPSGPGLTIDEALNVQQGVRTELGLRAWFAGGLTWKELFGDDEMLGRGAPFGYHATDYPPLGRYLLGLAHFVVTALAGPADWPSPFVITAARFAPALAFAVTLGLLTRYGSRAFGRSAGILGGLALLLMPRVFGHAHLASLETIIGLFYTATILSIAKRWKPGSAVSNKAAVFAGLWWGATLLVKMQAILIPLPVALWALWHWRAAAIRPLAIMGAVGLATFIAGWPWIWFDPLSHLWEYFRQTTDRAVLSVWYLGQVWPDHGVPWHYPWVMTAITVPVGLLALAGWGLFGRGAESGQSHSRTNSNAAQRRATDAAGWRDGRCQLIAAAVVTPLVVFSLPGVPVYDGARLFLVAFPPLAILAGRGGGLAWHWLRQRLSRNQTVAVAALFLAIAATPGWFVRPVYLSGYNWAIGGLAGAERLGFPLNYWGSALTSRIVEQSARRVPEGGTLAVSPVLHQFQLAQLRNQSPALAKRGIRLVKWPAPEADGLLIFARRASLPRRLRKRLDEREPEVVVKRQGVRLAAFYRVPPPP